MLVDTDLIPLTKLSKLHEGKQLHHMKESFIISFVNILHNLTEIVVCFGMTEPLEHEA